MPKPITRKLENVSSFFVGNEFIGKVLSLSLVQTSVKKEKKNPDVEKVTNYFEVNLQTADGSKRVMCFDKVRHKLFESIQNDPSQGVKIKRVKYDRDIIITEYTEVCRVAMIRYSKSGVYIKSNCR